MHVRLLLAVSLLGLSACVADLTSEEVTASLQKVTATALAAREPAAITIQNAERFPAKWQWQATYDGKTYACDADNRLRLPNCEAVLSANGG